MTQFLPDELKILVKERLRDARFVAREMRRQTIRVDAVRQPSASAIDKKMSGLTRKISDISDTALQTLETVAIRLLSSDPQAHFSKARAFPFGRYRCADKGTAQSVFARDCYFAAKQILLGKGCSNPRVSEELFIAAYRLAAEGWARPTDGSEDSDMPLDVTARNAAIMTRSIIQVRPVQAPRHLDMDPAGTLVDTNVYIAAAIGLATAVATHHRDILTDGDPVYVGVCAAVEARFRQIETAMNEPDQPKRLADVLADLVSHLP